MVAVGRALRQAARLPICRDRGGFKNTHLSIADWDRDASLALRWRYKILEADRACVLSKNSCKHADTCECPTDYAFHDGFAVVCVLLCFCIVRERLPVGAVRHCLNSAH